MKFLPTIDLWADGVSTALRTGALKLQRGQWVRCGKGNKPARFVDVRPCGTIWVAHWEGEKDNTNRKFKGLCKIIKNENSFLTNKSK